MDPYATHLEALVNTALNTPGDILELGCGDYSTPVLSAIAKSQGKRYRCQSSNLEWARRFELVEIVNWDAWEPPEGPWGMVFLDSDEQTWYRVRRIPALAKVTDTIVMHDADISMTREGWPAAVACFPKVQVYEKHRPWTAVLRKC